MTLTERLTAQDHQFLKDCRIAVDWLPPEPDPEPAEFPLLFTAVMTLALVFAVVIVIGVGVSLARPS